MSIDKREARQLLIQAGKLRRSVLQPCFSQIGLAFGQGHARILDTLLTEDHISQKELADRCQMDVTTISRSLDRLQQSGFLERQPDPASRRSFRICLTESGRQEARIVRRLLNQLDEQTWKGFQVEEMDAFCGYLLRVIQNLEQADLSFLSASSEKGEDSPAFVMRRQPPKAH